MINDVLYLGVVNNSLKTGKMKIVRLIILFIVCGSSVFSQGIDTNKKGKLKDDDYGRFRIAVHGGVGYTTTKLGAGYMFYYASEGDYQIEPDFQRGVYITDSEFDWGFNLGIDASYYLKNNIGVGFKYNRFKSSDERGQSGIYAFDFPTGDDMSSVLELFENEFGVQEDRNMTISFIGPMLSYRRFTKKGNALIFNGSVGYISYRYDMENDVEGGDLGFALDLGYDIKISKNWFFNVQLSTVMGKIKEAEADFGNEGGEIVVDKDVKLKHFDLQVGLSYCF